MAMEGGGNYRARLAASDYAARRDQKAALAGMRRAASQTPEEVMPSGFRSMGAQQGPNIRNTVSGFLLDWAEPTTKIVLNSLGASIDALSRAQGTTAPGGSALQMSPSTAPSVGRFLGNTSTLGRRLTSAALEAAPVSEEVRGPRRAAWAAAPTASTYMLAGSEFVPDPIPPGAAPILAGAIKRRLGSLGSKADEYADDIFNIEYKPKTEPPVEETRNIIPEETLPLDLDPRFTNENEAIAAFRDQNALTARQQAEDDRRGIIRDSFGVIVGKKKPDPNASSTDYLPLDHPARKLANDQKFETVEIDDLGRIHSATANGYYDLTQVKKQALATLRQGEARQIKAGFDPDPIPQKWQDIPDEWAQGILDSYQGPHYVIDKRNRKMISEGLTLDHGTALANGGANTLENLFAMLGRENFSKGAR